MKERLTGFFIGLLLMAEINTHGFLMGLGVTILAVVVMVLIGKYVISWLEGYFDK